MRATGGRIRRRYGAILALVAFLVACVGGALRREDAVLTLGKGLAVMIVCCAAGWGFGTLVKAHRDPGRSDAGAKDGTGGGQ